MRIERLRALLLVALLCVASLACGRKKRLIDISADLVEDLLVVLEDHVEDPAGAAPALKVFVLDNRLRLLRAYSLSTKQQETLTREERVRMNVQFLKRIEPLMERLQVVGSVYKERPEVLENMRIITEKLRLNPGAMKGQP